jgi:hypothetical protein
MSNRLTLCEAARQSGIGLHDLMKAIRSRELAASKFGPEGFVVSTRDLDRYIAARLRGSETRATPKPLPPVACTKPSTGSIGRVRTAFGVAPPPAPKPAEPQPAVRPARDLGQWCESYLDELRKVDWYLRKLEADARWLDEKLNGQ